MLQADRFQFPSRWVLPAAALILGVGARLYLAVTFYGNYDQASYAIVARIMLAHGNVYAETFRYNYSPVWAYVLLGLAHIDLWTRVPQFQIIVRGFLTLVDVADAVLIGAIAARLKPGRGLLAFSIYLLNPVAILLVGFHGQFENLAVLPLLGALYLSVRQSDRLSGSAAWLLGTASLLIKHLTVFSVWMLFVYVFTARRRLLMMALSVLVFLVSFLPYLPRGLDGIIHNVFLYGSGGGIYGIGLTTYAIWRVLHHIAIPTETGPGLGLIQLSVYGERALFVGLMVALPFIAKERFKLALPVSMELSAVALLALIPGISEQYFIIPVIFGSIFLSAPYVAYTAVTTIILLGSPFNVYIFDISIVYWNAIWIVTVIWLYFDARQELSRRHQWEVGELSQAALGGVARQSLRESSRAKPG